MGREPRRAGRRDQTRDTPADPASGRRVPSGEAGRDRQRGFPWPGEEPRRSQSAEEWLQAFGGRQGERPAVTGSAASRSRSRRPDAGQPSSAGPAVPQRSGRTAAGYPAERYGRGEPSRPEGGSGRAGAPGERLARQQAMREPGEPDRGPSQRRGPGSSPRPNPRTAPAPDERLARQQAMREPGEPDRGLSQRRGPGSSPRPNARMAPAPEERALRGPEPGRAPNPGRHARGDQDPRWVRGPDERAPARHDGSDAAGSAHPAAAGVRPRESRMPPVHTPTAAARPPALDEFGRAERHVPHPARRAPVTPATSPDDETIPLPVILGNRPAAHAAGNDRDALTPVRPARLDGPRYRGSGTRPLPAPMQAKLDQLNALYRTAEAIGEEALTRHFDRLSQRQGDLIREYFQQARLGRTAGGRGISDADSTWRASPRSTPLVPPH